MTTYEASRIVEKVLGSPECRYLWRDEWADAESKYLNAFVTHRDTPEDEDVIRFKNGSYIKAIKNSGPSVQYYSSYERSKARTRYEPIYGKATKPAEPPELQAGDTTQLDSFLGSFTTK